MDSTTWEKGESWFKIQGWSSFEFQREAWKAYSDGYSGLVNAPTGSGKTYSLLIPILSESSANSKSKGPRAIWITPIRALAKEIELSAVKAKNGLVLNGEWEFAQAIHLQRKELSKRKTLQSFSSQRPRVCTYYFRKKEALLISKTYAQLWLMNGTNSLAPSVAY